MSENVKNRLVKFEFEYIEDPSPSKMQSRAGSPDYDRDIAKYPSGTSYISEESANRHSQLSAQKTVDSYDRMHKAIDARTKYYHLSPS